MARKSSILKLIAAAAFISSLIIMLTYIFNHGNVIGNRSSQGQQKHGMEQLRKSSYNKQFEKSWSQHADIKLDYNVREPLTIELMTEMEKKIPSLPLEYFYYHSNKVMQKFENCAQYPPIQMLNFYNTYWQTFYINNSIYQLYGAYYDERVDTGPVIRILALSNHLQNEFPIIYCQLWYEDDNKPILAVVKEHKLIWDRNWGLQQEVYYPYLLTCKIPQNTNITRDNTPKVVNLVEHQCNMAKNSLRIIYEKLDLNEKKHEFAVCVKGLDFPYEDLSARLVEWLELLNILGVHKVFIYRLQIHPNMTKVLEYYEAKGFVEVREITLVGGVVNQPKLEHWLIKSYTLNKRVNELIPYNDCFYRNIYKYDYVSLLDIDEIIMPKGSLKVWQHLLEKGLSLANESNCTSGFSALCAKNVYFPGKWQNQRVPIDPSPSYMYMLNHLYRFKDYTADHYNVKCLHNTQHVLTLHNHYPLAYLNTSCPFLDLDTSYVQLQHYRIEASKEEIRKDHEIIKDANIYRFHKLLIEKCTKALKDLDFI